MDINTILHQLLKLSLLCEFHNCPSSLRKEAVSAYITKIDGNYVCFYGSMGCYYKVTEIVIKPEKVILVLEV